MSLKTGETGEPDVSANDPAKLLIKVAANNISDRKLRLFSCACCRKAWHALPAETRSTVEVVESFVDGECTYRDFLMERNRCLGSPTRPLNGEHAEPGHYVWDALSPTIPLNYVWNALAPVARSGAHNAIANIHDLQEMNGLLPGWLVTSHYQLYSLLRDIATPNPFLRWTASDGSQSWLRFGTLDLTLKPQFITLARAAYDERLRRAPGQRTVAEVLAQRAKAITGGCCAKFADYQGCDCISEAFADDGRLDNARLVVLADALSDGGCQEQVPHRFEVRVNIYGSPDGWCVERWLDFDSDVVYRNKRRALAAQWAEKEYHISGWDKYERCWSGTGHTEKMVTHPLLAHLRSPGPHVRGCWAIDLITGLDVSRLSTASSAAVRTEP